ncbi:putative porin [Opitutus sp. ER46]|uniref:putative porin n=1 Tax=Opitutus sp. ER46 TaxID=2161864 RepID=UPI000D31A419|nr:putative porin [Opitutus sp. ER46]PTY01096.1 hypothetical protein DB354_00760 [Opitutus sp. ER46]
MPTLRFKCLALLTVLALTGTAVAQDSGPLIDLLVRKGIVTDQEAEELRTELVRDFTNNTSAGKLNLSSALTEAKLSGDVRIRHQYEMQAPAVATGAPTVKNERTRERFRFRFNGDFALQRGWTTGFALETGQAADSGNQTFGGANDDYSLYLARAYIGWAPTRNFSLVLGKQKNPIYATDLRWDGDINPQGASEVYRLYYGAKDTLEFRALQNIMEDRNERVAGPGGRDAWLFEQQAVYTHWFGRDSIGNVVNSVVLAPGFATYNASGIDTATNETPFNGTTRWLRLATFAGEVNWMNVAGEGTSVKLYWDSSYNFESENRVAKAYGLSLSRWKDDPFAWLVGIGYAKGSGKTMGDYSARIDYREIGLGAADPNTSDSDFAFGKLSQRGFKGTVGYNLTDFATLNATYFHTTAIQDNLTHALANLDRSQLLQLDLVLKF